MNHYRILETKLKNHFKHFRQALILLGARQVGKTTLLKRIFPDALYLLADEKPILNLLETYSSANYKKFIKNHKQILIDEIHLLENPGRAVKIIYDVFPGIQLIITGSSSLHIKNKTAESMAGRAINYTLYPLTLWEYLYQLGIEQSKTPMFITDRIFQQKLSEPSIHMYSLQDILQDVLVYGTYPELLNLKTKEEYQQYLRNLAEKAIFKDIIELNLIEHRAKALELLQILAYQIGNLINYAEISRRLGVTIPTVQRYIEIFEQSFILYRIYPFKQNKRQEILKTPKIYFWDLGIRNALINNFANIDIRNDAGAMFENFIISEIKKEISYKNLPFNVNYWRIKTGAEVDLVLNNHNTLIGIEIKFTKGQVTKAFKNRYPNTKTMVLTAENFW